MKILFLSPVQPLLTPAYAKASVGKPGEPLPRWQMQASWVRALERQGHQVRVVKYTPDDRIRLGWRERIAWNLRVMREVGEVGGADLIIYSLGADVLLPQALYYIKWITKIAKISEKREIKLVVLSGVSPIKQGNPRERSLAALVDLAATNDGGHAEEWLKLGAKKAVVLPIAGVDPELVTNLDGVFSIRSARNPRSLRRRRKLGFDSKVLFGSSSMISKTPSSIRQRFELFLERDIDVLFIGTVTAERKRFFDKLRRLLPKTVRMVIKEFVWEEEYAELMSRAKIGINPLRPEMQYGVNLRTFEIPALGAMEITSFCRDEWLIPGKEVEVFGSAQGAAELVKKYLRDGRAREKMAAVGQRRVMREHTFDKRVERLMEVMGLGEKRGINR